MPNLKIGIDLASLRQSPARGLETAARLGAAGVRLDVRRQLRPGDLTQTGLRQFRKQLDDLNLRVAGLSFATRRGYACADDLDRRMAATRDALEMAHRVGTSLVSLQIGPVPAEDDSTLATLLGALSDLGAHSDRVGAVIAVRTVGLTAADLSRLLDKLPAGTLGLDLDPAGLIVSGDSPLHVAEELGSHVAHVTVRDAVRDPIEGHSLEVVLGRGTADFPVLLGTLAQYDYRNWLTIAGTGGEDPQTELGNAVKYLTSL